MSNITIVLRKDKINAKGIAPIHFRIVKNRRSTYISSGMKIPVKFWDDTNKKIKPSFPNSAQNNNLLLLKHSDASKRLLNEETENKYVTAKGISKAIKGDDCPGFFELGEMSLRKTKADCSVGTYDAREAILKKFKEFVKDKEIQLTDLTPQLLGKYDQYLQSRFNNSVNTRHSNFKFLKMVFKEAYKLDYLTGHPNPFDKYKIKTTSTTKEFLTEDEIGLVETIDLTDQPQLEPYRKLFIFACTAYGIRVSDLILLQSLQISGGRIKIKTKKTNNQLDVRLPQKALNIIEWFKEHNTDNRFVFGLAPCNLDMKDEQMVDLTVSRETAKYNKALRTIGKKAELEKPLSSHIARHAWATRALRKGLDLYQVSTLLTHSSVKQTQVYAKIVSEELDKAADLF